jgi:hypothetical protein
VTLNRRRCHLISSANLFKHLSIKPIDKNYNLRLLRWTDHVARTPLIRAHHKSWEIGSIILDLSDAHRWTGAKFWKRHFRVITFQPCFSNGVLFAVLKCRAQQKRHRRPHDKISGLSFVKSSQVKLLITNNAFCIVQRATAQSKTGFFRGYGLAEAPPGFTSRLV